jgi:predicted SnoaL-like aldol condensation-catalyzing enzyme
MLRKTISFLVLLSGFMICASPVRAQKKMSSQANSEFLKLKALNQKLSGLQRRQAQEDSNKKLVLDFYQQFFGDKDIRAADKYLAPNYIQHNPLAATGRAAVKAFFTPFFANPAIPKTKIDVRRVAADGDLVWLHIRSKTTGAERAVVDIFRVKDGQIVEHWDVIQPVPAKSANPNTMF